MTTQPCFIISPIGDQGSETRERADNVLECIIKPAFKSVGLDALWAANVHATDSREDAPNSTHSAAG